ncbi:MAG TPA: GNAT family N-acetyltransferase, partial [Micromonosporaceae bacterium]
MNDFAVRPYTDADAPSVVDFFNDVDRYAGVYPGFTVSEMNEWSSGWADRDANSRMVIGPEGAPVAFGVVDSPPEGGFRVDAFGAVAPAWRGRGLGRDLLAWQLERASRIHAASAPDREW